MVQTLERVRATRSRKAKVAAVAQTLATTDGTATDEVEIVATFLMGTIRQRRTGVGWRTLAAPVEAADEPSLTVTEIDAALTALGELSGSGSQTARREALDALLGAATVGEQELLRGLITGEVRTGALEGVLVEAIATAFEVPVAAVRRAAMLSGSTPQVAVLAAGGGRAALEAVGLRVGRPVQPMLAASAPDLAEALTTTGLPAVVDGKLDGIRLQVHRDGDDVTLWSRSLDELTGRFPEIVATVRSLDCRSCVLDGEALLVDDHDRPRAFQETAARSMTRGESDLALVVRFFDLLHLDGDDLLDAPLTERIAALERLVPAEHRVSQLVVETPEQADGFWREVLAAGHEGVVVKSLDGAWQAGRRGSGWVKVKPRHTLDLVVLAAEWGSGRRRGLLSNIHLGARDPGGDSGSASGEGSWVMLGKTFKGMTDEMLAWQTERFLELETHREGHVVHLRPEQVVEIAFDGLQRSTRYPGGLALRFARVLRYRDDKTAEQAETIETVRRLAGS